MWVWLLILALVIAAIAAGIPWVRQHSRLTLPEPDFSVRTGAFRELAATHPAIDPGRAEVALTNGMTATCEPQSLPPRGDASATSPDTDRLSGDWRDALWIAAPQAGLFAASLADTARSQLLLDDSMLAALSQLSGTQVDGLADLRAVMDVKDYQLDSVKIQGTVAEQVAGEDFANAGHTVAFPNASNNPGWDFTIDGQEVNSKLTVDFNNVANAHFSEYPDIPIVINADAANIPSDALRFDGTTIDTSELIGERLTIVDESLTLAGIEDISADTAIAADGIELDDGGVIPGLSLVIAAVRSGYREGKLLNKGKTNWNRAAKNIAIDTGAKGGGALAGGLAGLKAGALIDVATGGATLGLASAAGALLGALGGGLLGGKVANTVKHQPLYEAQENLQSKLLDLDTAIENAQSEASHRLENELATHQSHLSASAAAAHSVFESTLEKGRQEITRVSVLTPDEMRTLLAVGCEVVEAQTETFAKQFAALPWLERTMNRDAIDRVEAAGVSWLQQAQAMNQVTESSPRATESAFDLIMPLAGGREAARAFLGRISATRDLVHAAAIEANDNLVRTLVALRATTVESLNREADQISEEAKRQIDPALRRVEKARNKMLQELEMAGL